MVRSVFRIACLGLALPMLHMPQTQGRTQVKPPIVTPCRSDAKLHASVTLRELSGASRPILLTDGRAKVLHFWTTWSRPSQLSLAELSTFAARHTRDRLSVIAVAVDEQPAAVLAFAKRHPELTVPLATIAADQAAPFELRGVPTTLIVNGRGDVCSRFEGTPSVEAIEKAVAAMLAVGVQPKAR
jgi:thioredoxin family protein